MGGFGVTPLMKKPPGGKRTFKIVSIFATVRHWKNGGCHVRVPREWLGKEVAIFKDGEEIFSNRKIRGHKKSTTYALIPCDYKGQELLLELTDKI